MANESEILFPLEWIVELRPRKDTWLRTRNLLSIEERGTNKNNNNKKYLLPIRKSVKLNQRNDTWHKTRNPRQRKDTWLTTSNLLSIRNSVESKKIHMAINQKSAFR